MNTIHRRHTLQKLSITKKYSSKKEAVIIFGGYARVWKNNILSGLKWTKSKFKLTEEINSDWSKSIAIDDDRIFVTGGENYDDSTSAKVFIINMKTGFTEQM